MAKALWLSVVGSRLIAVPGRIKREDVEAVRAAARIEQIVGERVALKQAGVGSMKGLCPFHDERTPSFHVRPQLGLWHCFGCGEGGDTIAFLMKADSLGFQEAVEYLAGRTGIQLRYEEVAGGQGRGGAGDEGPSRSRLVEANRLAAEYFLEQLAGPEARAGRDFLRSRGFDRVAADRFGVGYAPQGWDGLLRHLRGRAFTDAELMAAGLVTQGQRGVYDRFRGRLMWPIRDLTGSVVGFGARRLLEDDQGPKYLNTPETSLYRKSQLLYGVDLAKRAIAREREVVVVEGYTDVMAMHLSGVEQAVATCGTAFGADHVRVVRRLLGDHADPSTGVQMSDGGVMGGRVVFTFDGDAAGQKAAMRAFAEDQRFYAQTFVAVAPGGMDPCELWQEQGEAALVDLVKQARPMFKFAIQQVLASVDLDTAEGRVTGLRAAAPMVAGIRDDALRGDYTRLLAGWVGLNEGDVRRAVRAARNRRGRGAGPEGGLAAGAGAAGAGPGGEVPAGGGAGPGAVRPVARPGARPARAGAAVVSSEDQVVQTERQVLAAVLQYPHLAPAEFDDLDGNTFQVPWLRAVHDAVRAAGGVRAARADAAAWVAQVRDFAAGPVQGMVTSLAVEALPLSEGQEETYVRGVIGGLLELAVTRQLAELTAKLGRMDADTSPEAHQALLAQHQALVERRGEIKAEYRGE